MTDPQEPRQETEPGSRSTLSPQGDDEGETPLPLFSTPPAQPPRLVRMAWLFYGALFAVAVLWAALAGGPLFYASQADAERGVALGRDLAAGLLAGGLAIWVSREATRRTDWGEELARALASVLGRLSPPTCAVLALLSGVAEETFFRGLLQPRLGLVWASLLFGLAHFVPSRALLPWTGFAVLAGLGFGLLFDATGNLVAPIAAHALLNAVNLAWLSRRYAD